MSKGGDDDEDEVGLRNDRGGVGGCRVHVACESVDGGTRVCLECRYNAGVSCLCIGPAPAGAGR